MAVFRRWVPIIFALGFAVCVVALDFTGTAVHRAFGIYGWGGVIFAAVFVGLSIFNWLSTRNTLPPGVFQPREAVFFIAGAVAAASVAARSMAALPAGNDFTALPGWPALYLALYLLIVGVGAFFWLSGRGVKAWALFTILLLAAANGQLFKLGAGSFGIYFGFTAVVFFFQMFPTPTSGAAKPRLSYVGAALLLFLLAAFVSLAWSQDWHGSFRTVYFLTNGFLIFIIFAREVETADVLALPPAVIWAVLTSEIVFEVALAAKLFMTWQWMPSNIPQENLFWTLGVSRNALSTYFVAALPFLLLGLKAPRPAAPRWLLWGQVALSVAVPVLSLSKSALLGLAAVLWFAFAFWGTERRMNLKLVAAGAVVVSVVLLVILALLPGGIGRYFNPLTYTTRLLMLKVAFAALRAHPLTGIGLGSALAWVAQAGVLSANELVTVPEFLVGHSHSIFLEVAGAMGLPGLVTLFIVIQTAVWAGANLVKVDDDRVFFGLINASVAGGAAILTVALGLALLSPIPIIIFLGLAMYEGGVRRRGLAAVAPAWLDAAFAAMVAVAAAIGLLTVAAAQTSARGEEYFRARDWAPAARRFELAARLTPWDPLPRSRLAACYINEGEFRAAYAAARGAVVRARGNAAYLEQLGLLSWTLGDTPSADAYLARAVAADPAGLVGGGHQTYYALFLSSRGRTLRARQLLAEAVMVDPWLARDAAFVSYGPDRSPRTYLRWVGDGPTLEKIVSVRLGRFGFRPSSSSRRVAELPTAYRRRLCLEDIYACEFKDVFEITSSEKGIAPPASYRLAQGYAEARTRAGTVFPEIAALSDFPAAEADYQLALFPSGNRDVERRRWELQALVGMALLAERTDAAAATGDIAAELTRRSRAVRREVAGVGETTAARLSRLRYYHLVDEQVDWDLELADTLGAMGDEEAAYKYYRRGLALMFAQQVAAGDGRLPRAVRGVLATAALTGRAAGDDGRPLLPRVRDASPAAFAAEAIAEEFFGKYKKALTRLRAGVARYPGDGDLKLMLAAFYERRGFPDKALEVTAGEAGGFDLSLTRARGDALARAGDVAASATVYAMIVARRPGDLLGYLLTAKLYLDAGDYDKALAALEDARAHVPPSSLWAARYGAVLLAKGDFEAAATYYARARALNPFDLEPYVVWGEELCRRGRSEEALPYLKRAVALQADSAWARLALAACYRRLGRDAAARRTYEAGIAREGLGSPITLAYDDYLKSVGDTASRRRVLAAALARDPTNATLRFRLGEVALAAGEVERGRRLLEEAVALEPTSPDANAALGYYYRTHGRAAESIIYYERARAARPGPAGDRFRILLADAYVETGRYEDALATLEPVAAPEHLAKTHFLRAKAYYYLGEYAAAAAAAARALELDPTMKDAEAFSGLLSRTRPNENGGTPP